MGFHGIAYPSQRGAFLVTLLLTGCGARSTLDSAPGGTSGAAGFPVGTYTNCADGVHASGLFLNTAGFEEGASLNVTQQGAALTATYVQQNGHTSSFDFDATSSTTATLASPTQVPGFPGLCVFGPGDTGGDPSTLDVTAGTLTYDAGTAFVALAGAMDPSFESDAGVCTPPQTPATFWIVCEDGPQVAPGATTPAHVAPSFLGTYTCTSQVETYDYTGGYHEYVTAGDSGTLTLTGDGAEVTAAYGGDMYLAGTLHLAPTTDRTAIATGDQGLTTSCMVPLSPPAGSTSYTPAPVSDVIASLAVVDTTLFLTFAGSMGAGTSCPGALKAGSLLCTKP